jgi:hypothetical protein
LVSSAAFFLFFAAAIRTAQWPITAKNATIPAQDAAQKKL